jgi:hypothetical protein
MKFSVLILALAALAVPSSGLCDEIKGKLPDQWLECFAATKLHQDLLASTGKVSLAIILQAGEPRVAYQRLARHWLTGFKKLDQEAAAGEMIKAPAEMKKAKSIDQIEAMARDCIVNIPDLTNPMFYQKYPYLGDRVE